MTFRERFRKALRRSSTSSQPTPNHSRKSSEVLSPELPTDRSPAVRDYRQRLESFSFASAWQGARSRRRSSQYSPMGSRLPSRSVTPAGRRPRQMATVGEGGVDSSGLMKHPGMMIRKDSAGPSPHGYGATVPTFNRSQMNRSTNPGATNMPYSQSDLANAFGRTRIG